MPCIAVITLISNMIVVKLISTLDNLVEEELTRLRERVARLTAESYDYRTRAERGETRNGMILRQLELMERNEINVVKEFKKLQSETVPMFNVSYTNALTVFLV